MRNSRSLHVVAIVGFLSTLAGCAEPDPNCTPVTCEAAGANCGEIDDGCGGTVTCGSCPDGQTCGGSGTANFCGIPGCTPTTCAEQGKNCGEIDDGCGGKLTCGTCSDGDSCGGGGIANVCGADCGRCPPGHTCGENGQCTADGPESLVLDVRTVTISGRVLHNGKTPMKTEACTGTQAALP